MPDSPLIDARLVRRLLASQLPDDLSHLAGAPVTLVGHGWDNVMFAVGDSHVVRLPLSHLAARLVEHEIAWVETAAAPLQKLGLAVPIPVFCGEPSLVFPRRWTIVPWIKGTDLSTVPLPDRRPIAAPLGYALAALHRPAPRQAPHNPYRSVPLASRAAPVADRWPAVLRYLGAADTAALREHWDRALGAPEWPGPPLWIHGDTHARNIIQRDGWLVGLIDFGDVSAGDPAVDLATGRLSFDAEGFARFREVADATGTYDPAIWDRAAGWAVVILTALIADPVSRRNFSGMVEDARANLT
ncbi:aminoglycoside phosphotransferase family protein [Raineyella sp. LH-20]|uniref:aminoglycoside phosphotransferase family protein n=1 Tax=Raineyella sp. LH-20 TaxID=3081204 RepID=UPI0029559B70|nr:aminoglycoside phosphotransferase family protein [Raineyella sp. LH-20]WOP18437.1 aminoglycoside phosphotransferase family protein [Raineyella sp. LH-20]